MTRPKNGPPVDANASMRLLSDAERDVAVDRLKLGYVEGRLTLDELDERMGLTLESRTVGDLAAARLGLAEPQGLPGPLDSGRRRHRALPIRYRVRVAAAAAVLGGVSAWWFS